MSLKKGKKPSVSQLKRKADEVFSQYIRLSRADENGYAACVTCGVVKHWKELQNGHYEKRSHNSLRYDTTNCNPQCPSCNVFKSGNYPRYAQYMVNTYGSGILEYLEAKAKEVCQFKPYQLQEIIDSYSEEIRKLTT